MLVVTDGDPELAVDTAREFGLEVYGQRHRIGFESISLPMEEALSRACASKSGPVVVADQSDNVGGGAPGDATFALQWLLDNRVQDAAIAIIYDPEVVSSAKRAGVGSRLSIQLGGKSGSLSGQPVRLDATVLAVRDDYAHEFPQQSGEPWVFQAGDVTALRCGTIDVIVSNRRCQCFSPSIFSDLGIDPSRKRILIPKSYQHFYAAFSAIAAEIILYGSPRRCRSRR